MRVDGAAVPDVGEVRVRDDVDDAPDVLWPPARRLAQGSTDLVGRPTRLFAVHGDAKRFADPRVRT